MVFGSQKNNKRNEYIVDGGTKNVSCIRMFVKVCLCFVGVCVCVLCVCVGVCV